jgi:tRNA-dihydrouridine synthase
MNLWTNLPKPFFVLAPMDDVTDTVFRQIVAGCAEPDVSFTEFVSVEGYASVGRSAVIRKLRVSPGEMHPLIAQIWGTDPAAYQAMAADLAGLGFDGIDINMGCPVRDIVKRGACSALIDNPKLAARIIRAVKAGAGELPVSVKTRIGTREIKTEEWLSVLLAEDLAAITVHGRTAAEMSKVPAHWDEIAKAVALRDRLAPQTRIIGNGDVRDRAHGLELVAQTGVDGIMIGRGIFQDPFAFAASDVDRSPRAMGELLLRHLDLYDSTWGDAKNFHVLKRFFKVYLSGFDGANALRQRLMETGSADEVRRIMAGEFGAIAR